jgi:UDP-N-acetylglucosamine--N-acetylmuramyl-(pentapeptide) pyrophosphoryl-undecaprenol N-acetylglucosamine transferase
VGTSFALGASAQAPRVHLAASLGGHLELLVQLRDAFDRHRPIWVTAAGDGADPLRAAGDTVLDLPRFNRSRPLTALKNAAASLVMVLRERPSVIVASGAGSVVAFCVFARLLGARVVFVETTARVTSPSTSGRVLSRIASRVLVQWPEMARVYRNAVVCRPALWEDMSDNGILSGNGSLSGNGTSSGNGSLSGNGTCSRSGTFVAVGTHRHQFDRLLEMVDRAVAAGVLPAPAAAQAGNCRYRPRHLAANEWMSQEELAAAIESAELVICHAGSGIISAALRSGHKPLVVPRRASHSEHVDDHQVQIVRKLASLGVIVPVDEEISHAHVAAARNGVSRPEGLAIGCSVRDVLAEQLSELLGGSDPGAPGARARASAGAARAGRSA